MAAGFHELLSWLKVVLTLTPSLKTLRCFEDIRGFVLFSYWLLLMSLVCRPFLTFEASLPSEHIALILTGLLNSRPLMRPCAIFLLVLC